MKKETESKLVIISEILFILLPIVVIAIVFLFRSTIKNLIYSSEWSFASIILFGQSIVKFSSGISIYKNPKRWQLISIIISAIIVLGLIPSVLILVLLIIKSNINSLIYIFQFIIFIIAIAVYFIFGTIGQIYLDNKTDYNSK